MVEWTRAVVTEWKWLFEVGNLVELSPHSFERGGEVVDSVDFWLVLFLDGLECSACKTARTNMMRVSAGLRGVASVGFINCEKAGHRALCDGMDMPNPPHAPQVKAFKAGEKSVLDKGEMLL